MLFKLIIVFLIMHCTNSVHYHNMSPKINTCHLSLNDTQIAFHSVPQTATYDGDTIYFAPCDDLQKFGCSKAAVACIKTPSNIINFEDLVHRINSKSVVVNGKQMCATDQRYCLEVVFSSQSHKPNLTKPEKCKYVLEILDPNLDLPCSKTINGRVFDFNELSQDIEISNAKERVIINLCEIVKRCKDNASSVCIINENDTASYSLGHFSTQRIKYLDNGNIEFEFKTGSRKSGRVTKLILKCHWTKLLGRTLHEKISERNHRITIETYLGCVKLPPTCVVYDKNYKYNITKLNKIDGWKISNNEGNDITTNFCGPLKSHGLCSEQLAQICLVDQKGRVQNLGSVMTALQVENDAIKTTYIYGSVCSTDQSQLLTTDIKLLCSFVEKGPTLKLITSCTYEMVLYTPLACPEKIDNGHSKYELVNDRNECSTESDGFLFDLSALSSTVDNYIASNGDIDYIINVCRPVLKNRDILCSPFMGMCSRNNSEPNIKKRFLGIGNVRSPEIQDGELILKYKSGYFSPKYLKELSAEIQFICSDKEDGPIFFEEKSGTSKFKWFTKVACRMPIQCILRDNLGNTIYLGQSTDKVLKILHNGSTYVFDICKNNFTIQKDDYNRIVQARRSIHNDGTDTYIEYMLNENCNKHEGKFNLVRLYLQCDMFHQNEHYNFKNIADCALNIMYKHRSICNNKTAYKEYTNMEITIPQPTNMNNSKKLDINVTENLDVSTNCSYQYRNSTINLNTLKPMNAISSSNLKYTIGINRTATICHEFVCNEHKQLASLQNCPKASKEGNDLKIAFESLTNKVLFRSEIIFKCPNYISSAEVVLEGSNMVMFHYPLEEVCYNADVNYYLITGVIICILIIMMGIGFLCKDRIKKRYKTSTESKAQTYVYVKNGDE